MKNKKIKVGVIGLGIGNLHAKVAHGNPNANLVAVCDKNKKLRYLAKKYNCNFELNPRRIINDNSINLISIASYDNYHFQQIRDSIKKNKNVFIEKPFCQNINQYKILKNLIQKKNIYFSTNFVLRNHPKFLIIKKIIKNNSIGKVYHIEGDYNYGRLHKLTKGWRGEIPFYSVTQGGGIHMIDLIIWLTNSYPKKVFAIGNKISTKNSNFKFYDNVTSIIKLSNQITAKINSNFGSVSPHDHQMRIFGTKGSIFLSQNELRVFKSRNPKIKEKITKFKSGKNYKLKIFNKFIESITKRKKFKLISLKEVFASMSTCLYIDKSLKSKKIEKVFY